MRVIILLLAAAQLWGAGAQRIISTAPSITETLFGMGLGPRVVGVTIYCKFPAEALKIAKIGTYLKPDIEAIVALHPDLVVVQKQGNNLSAELDRMHIRYVEVQSFNLDYIYAGARAIGKAADAGAAAEQMISRMQAQLKAIEALTAGKPMLSAVFIVGHTAGSLEGLIAGSGTSYFSDLLTMAGGRNVFMDTQNPYPKISMEEILSRDPDFIFELSGESRPKQEEVVTLWKTHRTLKAVAAGHVYAIPSGPFLAPGPRAVEATKIVLGFLHPELKP